MSYKGIDDYIPSPRSTDPADIIEEKNIAIHWLREQLDQADAVIRDRERVISQLIAGGTTSPSAPIR